MISLKDYITASGKYPEREQSEELTEEVRENAVNIVAIVNAALEELGVKSAKVSSGFRPSSVNAAVGGAKRSAHQSGEAIDLVDDKDSSLDKLFTRTVLERFNLYREDSNHTPGWCHLQTRATKSGKRIFKP